jgi:hypothetical protein
VLLLVAVTAALLLLAPAQSSAPGSAVLYDCQPLLLTSAPEQGDQHPYIRAASSIVRLPDAHSYAVVQDDVGYIGLVTMDEHERVIRVQQKVALPPSDSSQNRCAICIYIYICVCVVWFGFPVMS